MPRIAASLLLLAALLLTGCQQEGQITAYTVAREGKPATQKARMLVAMFPQAKSVWFFRLDGPEAEVAKQAKMFELLVESVRFPGKDEPPTWMMPEGWTREPGNQFRYATLRVGPLTGRVSKLDAASPEASSVLLNLNRFRGEVGLPPITDAEEVGKDTRPIEVEGAQAIWFDLTGPGGKGGGPMMKF